MPAFLGLWGAAMLVAYGILFGFAVILSRRPFPSWTFFRRLNGLLYLASFGAGALWAGLHLGSLPEVLVLVLGAYILSVLLLTPSLYLMTRRRRPIGPFRLFAVTLLGAKLVMALPFFLTALGYLGVTGLFTITGPIATAAVAMGMALTVAVLFPYLLALTLGRRSDALSAAAADLAHRAHMKPPKVMLLPTRAAAIPNAFVMGPFNRYVFVTDDLYERSGLDATLATIAHELGHRSRRHIPRLLFLLPAWALLTSVPWVGSLPMLLAFPLLLLALMRSGEYEADHFGARLVGTEAMVRNLAGLEVLTGSEPEGKQPRRFSLFATHPTIDQRVTRLLKRGPGGRRRGPGG